MKNFGTGLCLFFFLINVPGFAVAGVGKPESGKRQSAGDSLPAVFTGEKVDCIYPTLRREAALAFQLHQLPLTPEAWKIYSANLKKEVIRKAGVVINHGLPLDLKETGRINRKGYSIRNLMFQTRPGVYATANLYVPEGKGPFPAVINMHGHWQQGRLHEQVQGRGHSLALNGYVCLSIDAWGSGERSTSHGAYEYHGANLGSSLLNIGETLLGSQVSDNMRGVDLLASLPYVDAGKIGATGESGGGNQTMWLTALDDRIKASVTVVSIGTFDSYIMRSNCICELLPDGLTFTEEAGVLALAAPRAIKICNALKDSNPTFFPAEMLRSYQNASRIYDMAGASKNLSYQLFNTEHGYWPEMRETMLGWFDLQLIGKGDGLPKKEIPFVVVEEEELMVFKKGQRDPRVKSIAEYCSTKGEELRKASQHAGKVAKDAKKQELRDALRCGEKLSLKSVHEYTPVNGWGRAALVASDERLVPVLYKAPAKGNSRFVILSNTSGKQNISLSLVDSLAKSGSGIVYVDLLGVGESATTAGDGLDKGLVPYHTVLRSELWLGKTVLGEWVRELDVVSQFIRKQSPNAVITIDANKEAGLAGLFFSVLDGKTGGVTLRESPVSYRFDKSGKINYFSMAIHVPGILNWGDVSLASALSGSGVTFVNPVSMSGRAIGGDELALFKKEFEKSRADYKGTAVPVFK